MRHEPGPVESSGRFVLKLSQLTIQPFDHVDAPTLMLGCKAIGNGGAGRRSQF